MKHSWSVRRGINVLMTLALFFLMGYLLWGETAHERVGIGMGVLFFLHVLLNRRGMRALARGPHSLLRVVQLAVDLLAGVAMLALLASGLILSGFGFAVSGAERVIGGAQTLHLAASHWLYVLLSLHLGLHPQLFARAARHLSGSITGRLVRAVCVLFALYGFVALYERDFLEAMAFQMHFLFFNFSEPALWYYIDLLAIMASVCLIGYGLMGLTRRLRHGRD